MTRTGPQRQRVTCNATTARGSLSKNADNHRCRAHSVTGLLQVARAGASARDTKAPPILPFSSGGFHRFGADKLIPGNQRGSRPLRPVYIAVFLPREVGMFSAAWKMLKDTVL